MDMVYRPFSTEQCGLGANMRRYEWYWTKDDTTYEVDGFDSAIGLLQTHAHLVHPVPGSNSYTDSPDSDETNLA